VKAADHHAGRDLLRLCERSDGVLADVATLDESCPVLWWDEGVAGERVGGLLVGRLLRLRLVCGIETVAAGAVKDVTGLVEEAEPGLVVGLVTQAEMRARSGEATGQRLSAACREARALGRGRRPRRRIAL
jgi:hypothetical protein